MIPIHDNDDLDAYNAWLESQNNVNKKDTNYAPFYGGIVLMVAGAAILASTEGWIAALTGIFILLFGIGLVCVGWSTENEK